jgi:hypothetical protein
VRFLLDEVKLEHVFFEFLRFFLDNQCSTIDPYSSAAIALTRQQIIASSGCKLLASALMLQVVGYRVRDW